MNVTVAFSNNRIRILVECSQCLSCFNNIACLYVNGRTVTDFNLHFLVYKIQNIVFDNDFSGSRSRNFLSFAHKQNAVFQKTYAVLYFKVIAVLKLYAVKNADNFHKAFTRKEPASVIHFYVRSLNIIDYCIEVQHDAVIFRCLISSTTGVERTKSKLSTRLTD